MKPTPEQIAAAMTPTLATHRARANRNGLSRWTVKTPRGKRAGREFMRRHARA